MKTSHDIDASSAEDERADDTPIEAHLDALAEESRLPVAAVRQCVLRVAEAAPILLALLAKAADGNELMENEASLLFRGLYVLAEARDEQAFQPLLKLMRLPNEELDYLLGDATTASLPKIAASVFDGDITGLFEAATDRSLEEFVRAGFLDAAVFLTHEKRIPFERMESFLARFDEEKLADDGDYTWNSWAGAIALLNVQSLVPSVERKKDGELFFDGVFEYDYFLKNLERAQREPDNIERFTHANLGYVDDAVSAQLWADHDDKSPHEDLDDYVADDERFARARLLAQMTAEAPWLFEPKPKVGRNDPCPCGSGKKYKKCCLAT